MILTANSFCVPTFLAQNVRRKTRSKFAVRSLSESFAVVENKRNEDVSEKLQVLWDDGFGTQNREDFYKLSKDFIKSDGGPPRWFCPISCGRPLKDSPLLLYLPGLDGLGLGLILHEKALGKVFEVRCLHIPVQDRTGLADLVKFIEETVKLEHDLYPKKAIYIVGDSFGGCLSLAIAANNPTIDLVLILVNPATSFERSQLPTLLFLLEALPNGLSGILPKDALIRRLNLVKSAANYANSHLHVITAEVLVLASYKDKVLSSKDESQRLVKSLQNCGVCIIKGNHHNLLLESDINLLTIIKGSTKYRRTSYHDSVKDYIPPSMSEYKMQSQGHWLYQLATSPVMLSTLEDGKIVTGLSGIPNEGPILFVGNHMLMGLDLFILFLQFLKEKRIMLRGLGRPQNLKLDIQSGMPHFSILLRVFGMLPVTPNNFFKLFQSKSYVLLYPGGAREALHCKGEVYKLFWPEQQEFVRMAAKFGATIIPFGSVGEDDVAQLIMDYEDRGGTRRYIKGWATTHLAHPLGTPLYEDMTKIPVVNNRVQELNGKSIVLRQDEEGDVANQQLHIPLIMPKIPGRFYYLFGKPIKTKGLENILKDKEISQALYMQIKSEVEKNIVYLIKKRDEDPYRSLVTRVVYQAKTSTPWDKVPTFEP